MAARAVARVTAALQVVVQERVVRPAPPAQAEQVVRAAPPA
jgi:hypothetical protein